MLCPVNRKTWTIRLDDEFGNERQWCPACGIWHKLRKEKDDGVEPDPRVLPKERNSMSAILCVHATPSKELIDIGAKLQHYGGDISCL
jgi:hypothetical protein